jgi:hypothetical protein
MNVLQMSRKFSLGEDSDYGLATLNVLTGPADELLAFELSQPPFHTVRLSEEQALRLMECLREWLGRPRRKP